MELNEITELKEREPTELEVKLKQLESMQEEFEELKAKLLTMNERLIILESVTNLGVISLKPEDFKENK